MVGIKKSPQKEHLGLKNAVIFMMISFGEF